jgi:hypothetical protein
MSSLFTNRKTAYEILEDLRENGVSDESILEYIICNNLTGAAAHQLMVETREEFLGDGEDEDDVSELQGDESDFSDSEDDDDFGDSDDED